MTTETNNALSTLRATAAALRASLETVEAQIAEMELEEARVSRFLVTVGFSEMGETVAGQYGSVGEAERAIRAEFARADELPAGCYYKTDVRIESLDSGESFSFRWDVNEGELDAGILDRVRRGCEGLVESAEWNKFITAEKVEKAEEWIRLVG